MEPRRQQTALIVGLHRLGMAYVGIRRVLHQEEEEESPVMNVWHMHCSYGPVRIVREAAWWGGHWPFDFSSRPEVLLSRCCLALTFFLPLDLP